MSDMRQNDRPTLSGTAGSSNHPKPAAAAEQVRATAGVVREEAAGVLSEAKAEVSDVADKARERAESFAEEQKAAGAVHAEGIARAVHRAADELQDASPQLAGYVREAGEAVSSLARNMRDRSLGNLAGDVQELARRQPVAFFGAAIFAGFAISRFVKSSSEGAGHGEREHRHPEDWPRTVGPRGMTERENHHPADINRRDGHRGAAGSSSVSATGSRPGGMAGPSVPGATGTGASMPGTAGSTAASSSSPPSNLAPNSSSPSVSR
jgi:hypothetical protein